jgi:hypothetical protein
MDEVGRTGDMLGPDAECHLYALGSTMDEVGRTGDMLGERDGSVHGRGTLYGYPAVGSGGVA